MSRPKIEAKRVTKRTASKYEISFRKPTGEDMEAIADIFEDATEESLKNADKKSMLEDINQVYSQVELTLKIKGEFYEWDEEMGKELPFADTLSIMECINAEGGVKKK